MKPIGFLFLAICAIIDHNACAQKNATNPKATSENWTAYNRKAEFKADGIHLNAQQNDGVLWLNDQTFENGNIELDIKGKNTPGQSFVGVAFHGIDNTAFDAVYFRPFNFKNPERNDHSVQYISMPKYDWSALRNAFPGKYENVIQPLPEPVDDWFHVKIEVSYPEVKVYVNRSNQPTLEIEQISDQKQGKIGLWVGNGSEGWFKNLQIY